MAGGNLMWYAIAFLAGVVFSSSVRKAVDPILGQLPGDLSIPSFYADSYYNDTNAYPAEMYPTTMTSFVAGNVYEKDYQNADELHINHLPIS